MWCIDRKLTLSISHLPGKLNTEADKASREFHNNNTEWSLDQTALNELKLKLGEPDVDMFASRLNHKTPLYIAWRPDPGAVAIAAFTVDWSKYNLIYCFPRFSLIGKVLQFIQESKTTAILVYPHWPTQFWYPHLRHLMKSEITSNNQDAQEDSNIASSTRGSSPSVSQASTSWMSCVKSSLIHQGVTGEPLNIILESWRSGTRKQYQTYVSAMVKFCSDNSANPINPTLQQVLEFLSFQSKTVGYSAVGTFRSALSAFIKIDGRSPTRLTIYG